MKHWKGTQIDDKFVATHRLLEVYLLGIGSIHKVGKQAKNTAEMLKTKLFMGVKSFKESCSLMVLFLPLIDRGLQWLKLISQNSKAVELS